MKEAVYHPHAIDLDNRLVDFSGNFNDKSYRVGPPAYLSEELLGYKLIGPDTFKGLGFRGMDGAGTAVEERQHAESDALISPRVRDVGLAMIGGMDVPEAGVAIAMERMRSKLRWVRAEGVSAAFM